MLNKYCLQKTSYLFLTLFTEMKKKKTYLLEITVWQSIVVIFDINMESRRGWIIKSMLAMDLTENRKHGQWVM